MVSFIEKGKKGGGGAPGANDNCEQFTVDSETGSVHLGCSNKISQTGGLQTADVGFLPVLEGRKFENKGLGGSVSAEGSAPGLGMAHITLDPQVERGAGEVSGHH